MICKITKNGQPASSPKDIQTASPERTANSSSFNKYTGTPYSTRDLHLGAYLKLNEIEFLGTKRSSDGVTFFMFKDCPEIQKLIREFFTRGSFISDYKQAVDELKSLIGRVL